MTENKRFCKDCKHTKGIGYDFWCGEGHTEYEVFLGETNCPYYKYHDWSKGTPKTENKRFYLLNYKNYPIYDSLNDKEYNAQFKVQREKLCLLLNELNDENQRLIKKIDMLERIIDGDVE